MNRDRAQFALAVLTFLGVAGLYYLVWRARQVKPQEAPTAPEKPETPFGGLFRGIQAI